VLERVLKGPTWHTPPKGSARPKAAPRTGSRTSTLSATSLARTFRERHRPGPTGPLLVSYLQSV